MSYAVIYTRTSTGSQELGHTAQEDECRALAARLELEVRAVYRDTCSGTIPPVERAGFGCLLDALSADVVVLMYRRDRLGRSLIANAVTEQLINRVGASLNSLDARGGDDPEAVLTRSLMDVLAQYERALISRRTQAALRAKKSRGERVGTIPLGYTLGEDQLLTEDAEERAKVERVRAWRAEGHSFTALKELCARHGVLARSGQPPSRGTIAKWCEGVEAPARAVKPRPTRSSARGGRPSTNERQPRLTATIRDLSQLGYTIRQIVDELAARGYTTSKGKPLGATQVGRVLRRARAEGRVEERGERSR